MTSAPSTPDSCQTRVCDLATSAPSTSDSGKLEYVSDNSLQMAMAA